jgi:hypothetical protein
MHGGALGERARADNQLQAPFFVIDELKLYCGTTCSRVGRQNFLISWNQ